MTVTVSLELEQELKFQCTCWVYDNLKDRATRERFMIRDEDYHQGLSMGEWTIGRYVDNINHQIFGLVMNVDVEDLLRLELIYYPGEGFSFVRSASLVRFVARSASDTPNRPTATNEYDIGPTLVGEQELKKYRAGRHRAMIIASKWYLKRRDPVLDSDIGTEPNDWEIIECGRADTMTTEWNYILVRTKTRLEYDFNPKDFEAGVLRVTVDGPEGAQAEWKHRPWGEWEMIGTDKTPKPQEFGTWQ